MTAPLEELLTRADFRLGMAYAAHAIRHMADLTEKIEPRECCRGVAGVGLRCAAESIEFAVGTWPDGGR